MKTLIVAAVATGFIGSAAQAETINLNNWTAEDYPAVSGFAGANWNVDGLAGETVVQTLNGQPTVFLSDTDAFGTKVSGTASVETNNDDDFFGFVLGFNAGDASNAAADFLLIDWKQGTQSYNFSGGAASLTSGGTAQAGLAISRVLGTPTADELWTHVGEAANATGSVQELARGATLGNLGYSNFTDYEFVFDFGPSNLIVEVNGVEQFNLAGNFSNGSLGFYNFSQDSVKYSAFETTAGSFPAVPLPAGGWLLLSALGAGAAFKRRKQ